MCEVNPSSCAEESIATCSLCATGSCSTHQAVTPNGNVILVCTNCQKTYSTPASAEIPESLQSAHERWVRDGRPTQKPFGYHPEKWIASLPEHDAFIENLPPTLSRNYIAGLGAGAHESEARAVETFIAGQIWGWGVKVGYGPFRTKAALSTAQYPSFPLTPDQKLRKVALLIRENGIVAGFRAFGTSCKLEKIGPSFGTKYLYFVSSTVLDRHPALILDSVVAEWLNANTTLFLNSNDWSSHQYGQYLFAVYSWAADLGEAPDAVELIVFQDPNMSPPTGKRQVFASGSEICKKCRIQLQVSGKCGNCDD